MVNSIALYSGEGSYPERDCICFYFILLKSSFREKRSRNKRAVLSIYILSLSSLLAGYRGFKTCGIWSIYLLYIISLLLFLSLSLFMHAYLLRALFFSSFYQVSLCTPFTQKNIHNKTNNVNIKLHF
ncbi:hypothetical protein BD560DRAFT_415700 [Blakeslea trispora]|nr:hypothetical protein BD560DRAFT_415700 [Blakeslea trispora]